MAKEIITVGIELPGGKAQNCEIKSNQSLQDYDLVVFDPNPYTIYSYGRSTDYNGLPCLDDHGSTRFKADKSHWRSELKNALDDGKTVFIFLRPAQEFSARTGQTGTNGTGRNATTINYVGTHNSYEYIPLTLPSIKGTAGKKLKFTGKPAFASFWKEMEQYLSYEAYLEEAYGDTAITTPGGRTVGTAKQVSNGYVVFLPVVDLEQKGFTLVQDGEEFWSDKAEQFSQRFLQLLVEIDKSLRAELELTPPPAWVAGVKSKSAKETALETDIKKLDTRLEKLEGEKLGLQASLQDVQALKGLLFEKGKPLEKVILHTLRLMGYKAENYDDGELELDGVIVGPEGERFIGEFEGKDKAAVNIDKFRQLNTNLDEDLERDEVTERAQGILFGNGFRLTDPQKRAVQFTDKCLTNAARTSTILIQSSDMHKVAAYLTDRPNDDKYKAECRKAIVSSKGKVVVFPPQPIIKK